MKLRFYCLITCFFALINSTFAQSTFLPKNLGSEVNTPYDEINPVITADGKTLYFTRLNHPDNSHGPKKSADIWKAVLSKDGKVISSQPLTSLNTGKYNSVLSVAADGRLLIYSDKDFYTVAPRDQGWETPQQLEIKASADAAMSYDGQYIVFSKGGNMYVIQKAADGTWGKPVALKALNTTKETTPFLLADNKTIYFTSDPRNKQSDIYKAERLSEDWNTWSTPVALNDTINSAQPENYLHTTPNGSWGYYSSANNSLGKADIFRVKLYEDNPFVEVSGTVINAVTKRPLRHLPIQIRAEGSAVDSVKINPDSATFKVKLPLGKSYHLSAQVAHYKELPITIDATNIKEYTPLKANLEEGPVPYVVLHGKLLIKNTGLPIPGKAVPTIVVDGEVIDSAKVDLDNSTYSLKLNHGAVYYVQVSAKRFESFPALLDFTSYDGYELINLDLQADAEKMAIITGKILDKRTNKSVVYPVQPAIEVEGVSSVSAIIDSLTGSYELRLPLKMAYTLSARITGYYPISESVDVSKESSEVTREVNLTAVPVEKGKTVLLKTVTFEPGKATLSSSNVPALDKLAAYLLENPKVKIEVAAYTSKTNRVSTLNMAKTVIKYLASKGVPAGQAFAKGYGIAKEGRVEFTFLTVN